MTSVLRRYAQIDSRTQYFIVLTSSVQAYIDNLTNSKLSSLMTLTDVAAAFLPADPTISYTTGTLLKDLGRQITVYDPNANNAHIAIFRQVMLVSGQNTEGVPTLNPPIPYPNPPTVPPYSPANSFAYICTWVDHSSRSAPFVLAEVARTG